MFRRSSLLCKEPVELAHWTIYNTGGSNSEVLIGLYFASFYGHGSSYYLNYKDIGIIAPLETISFEAIKNKHVISVESNSSGGNPANTELLPTSFGYEQYIFQFGFSIPVNPNGNYHMIATELNPYIELVCTYSDW